MKIIFKCIFFCMMGMSICSASSAQSSLQLTLKEAQEYAVQNNKTVRNAGLSVSRAQKQVWESISAGLPQASATLDYQNMLGFKMDLFGQSIPLEATSTLQAQITQLLFSGSYWVGIKMSRIGEEVSETTRLQSELDARQQARSAYLSILVALENKAILENTLKDIQTLAQNTSEMVKVGVAEQTDADQLTVQVASVTNSIKTVERGVELAYNLLRFHLGVDINTEIILKENLHDLISMDAVQTTLTTPFDMADNYNIRLLDKQVELADKQIQMAKASALPNISLFYNYTYKLKTSSFDMTPNNIIGLRANIPIFASGQRYVQIQQAKIEREIAQNSKDLANEQLLLQEKQLRFNLNSSVEAFNLQKEALEVAQRVLESVTRKYQQGVASSLDVTTANTSLLQAQGNYISAINGVITAQTDLEKLLNTL